MVTGIPLPGQPGEALLKGINSGSSMFSRLMQPVLEREKQKQLEEHFQEQLKLSKAASGRAAQSAADAHRKMDPKWQMQQLQQKIAYLNSLRGQNSNQSAQGVTPEGSPQDMMKLLGDEQQEMSQGQGALMPEEESQKIMPQTQKMAAQNQGTGQLPAGLNIDEIIKGLTYQSLGLKQPANGIYKEPPELKRRNDLKTKMDEAKYKHDLKIEEAKTAADLKNEQTHHKVIEDARNDLPHLNETLRSLKIMKKIADDPANKDLFGHWIEGHDTAAKRAKNPNAGTWQVYGLDPIVAAEMKMAARGNQLALKSALSNKANFAEDQGVAASKINGAIDKISRQIKEMSRIANDGSDDFSKMSDEELRAIAGGK
jgi:hypothetical protein